MKFMSLFTVSALMLVSQYSMAVALGTAPLSTAPLPLDIGGIVAIGAASLIIGTQLIKRRK
jgi:hypothetical protein